MSDIRIGLLGYGRMGAAMGARIMSQGHALTVWNRSAGPAAAAEAAGARAASTPKELAENCDVVVSSLFDEAAVRAVYFGAEGVAASNLKDRLVIDTSTVSPDLGLEIAAAIARAGGRFVDAPVLGTVTPAREGRLIALLGGTSRDVAEAGDTMRLVSRAVHPLGPTGAGYAGKLAINLLKGTYWAALGDCLGLAGRFGIQPGAILDVIESGPGALVELAGKMPVLRGMATAPAFDIAGCFKDLSVIIAAAGGAERVPVAAGALRAVERAMRGGWGNRDVASVALFAAAEPKLDM